MSYDSLLMNHVLFKKKKLIMHWNEFCEENKIVKGEYVWSLKFLRDILNTITSI